MVKNRAGFTIIEVIIAVIVITLLSAASLSSYGQFNERKKIDKTTDQLISVLELAKKKSLALDKNIVISGTDYSECSLQDYHVVITSTTTYSLRVNICSAGTCSLNPACQEKNIANYTVETGSQLDTTGTITFAPRTGLATGKSVINVTHVNLNYSKTITIAPSGLIE